MDITDSECDSSPAECTVLLWLTYDADVFIPWPLYLEDPRLPHKLSVQVLHQSCGLGVFLAIVFQDYSWIRLESYFYAFFGGVHVGDPHKSAL